MRKRVSVDHLRTPKYAESAISAHQGLPGFGGHVEPITPAKDAKLQRLLKWSDEEPLLRSHKLLIFTQYIDTSHYPDSQTDATPMEFIGAVSFVHHCQSGKQLAGLRKAAEELHGLFSEVQLRTRAGFSARIANRSRLPADVLGV